MAAQPADPLRPYAPSAEQPWNLERVRRLHWRAGYGASWRELERDLERGPEASIDAVLAGVAPRVSGFDERQRQLGDVATTSQRGEQLCAWWVYRILWGGDPLRERMALVWHDWFATSLDKVQRVGSMRRQNELFRAHGLGRFGTLLEAVVKDPALLVYLDAPQNKVGHLNENLGRELLELFTLGVGAYTEADVKEASRALTGWSFDDRGQFVCRASEHDGGAKTVLGRTGALDGDDLLGIVLAHPATARSLARRLCEEFLGEAASEVCVEALAERLRASDLDLGDAVAILLRSEAFFAEQGTGPRFQGPTDFVASLLRSLAPSGARPSTVEVADWIGRIGQRLFFPPNVGGWHRGRGWFTQQGLLARANFAEALARGSIRGIDPLDVAHFASCADGDPRRGLCRAVLGRDDVPWFDQAAATGDLTTFAATLFASPEAQLA